MQINADMTKKQLLFYVCCLTSFCIKAQDVHQNFLDSLSGKFISDIRKQGKPKAWLVSDKSIFKPGETIWFRGFLLNSVSHKVTSQSPYLFVDLVNEKDSVFASVLLDAASQQLSSKINLPATIPGGYYWLRAYTRLMAEADTNNAFVKAIYVTGARPRVPGGVSNAKTSSDNGDPVVQFYPEGGNIITGANSTVALLIKDPQGKPVATDGYIKDTRDSIVARFTSNTAGLGKFDVYASSFRRYKAFINWNGKQISYPLPSFNFFAGQLAVTKQPGDNKVLRVLLEDSIYKKNIVTYVIGVSRDSLCYAAIGYGQYELAIPEQKFPQGVATFYLFDNNGKLLSERSIYIKENNVIVKTTVDKNAYSKRDKVSLSISVTDANNRPLPSLLSVCVADSAFTNPASESILTSFNDPGFINNSGLAYSQNMTDEEMDLVMLTNNHTYKNSNIAKSPFRNDDSLLFIKGKALDEKDRPATNKILTLISNNNSGSFFTDTTDNTGKFSFPVYYYPDSTEFAIDAKNTNESTANIKIVREPVLFPLFSTPASLKHYFLVEPVFTTKYRTAYFDNTTNNAGKEWENEVTVKGKKKKELAFNNARRVSTTSTIITGDQLDERRSTGDIVLTVGGLHVVEGVLIVNGLTSMGKPTLASEPLLLIDGVQAPNAAAPGESAVLATLNSINPKEIDFIEILKGPEGSNYGMRGGNGVIIVNMAHQSRQNFRANGSNLQTFYAKGISRPSLFPIVNYDNKNSKSSEQFDNRSTIFWNGSVLTGGGDNFNASFFTTDVPTTYRVTVTGVTVHGDLIYKTLTFNSR